MNLLQLTVKDQETGKSLLLNGEESFEADFDNHGIVPPTPRQVLIAEKGDVLFFVII